VRTALSADSGARRILWAAAVGATLFVAPGARADNNELDVAAQFFEAGAAAARKREFRVCAEAFTEAHKRAPHGATIYNAALCWDGDKQPDRAANDYEESLALGNLSPQQKVQAEKRLAKLKKELGRIEVTDPKGVRGSVGPIKQKPIPFSTYVSPGDYQLRVEGPDGELVTRDVEVEPGETQSIALQLEKPEPETAPNPTPPKDASTPSNFQRTTGWVLVGAGVVATGVGFAYYASSLTAKQEFDNVNGVKGKEAEAEAKHQLAIDRYSLARAFWIGAVVAGGAGVALILTSPKSTDAPKAALHVHPTGVSASITF